MNSLLETTQYGFIYDSRNLEPEMFQRKLRRINQNAIQYVDEIPPPEKNSQTPENTHQKIRPTHRSRAMLYCTQTWIKFCFGEQDHSYILKLNSGLREIIRSLPA